MIVRQSIATKPNHLRGFNLSDSLMAQLESSAGNMSWALSTDHTLVEVNLDSLLSPTSAHFTKTLAQLSKPHLQIHGRGLSVASMDNLDVRYLKNLKEAAQLTNAQTVSDFIAWTGVGGRNIHALMPAVFNSAMLSHLTKRISDVQDVVGRPLVLENTLAPVSFKASEMSEPAFLNELSRRTGATFALNLSTLYRNSIYQDFDPEAYLQQIHWTSISQLKLSMVTGEVKKITGADPTNFDRSVWALLSLAIRLSSKSVSKVPALIVRDEGSFDLSEIQKWTRSAYLFLEESARGAKNTSGNLNSPS